MKILITGTSSGIGYYLATNLKNKFKIIGVSRTKNNIENIDHFCGDINDINFLKNIAYNIDYIDYLILNAGIGYFDEFKNLTLQNHIDIINTNLTSNILLTSLLLEKIKIGIIFIGSISSKKSGKFGASYQASKFGLRGFAMGLKNELNKLKIYFINPKIIRTNLHKNSKVKIVGKFKETKIDEVLETIENIINKKENRFEIDL